MAGLWLGRCGNLIARCIAGDFKDQMAVFPDAVPKEVSIEEGDAPEASGLRGAAVLNGGHIDMGRLFLTHGTVAMWIKPEEVPEDGRILGPLPLAPTIKATAQTITTKEGQPVEIVLGGEGESLKVTSKAVLDAIPEAKTGFLQQVPGGQRLNGKGAVVSHAERKV